VVRKNWAGHLHLDVIVEADATLLPFGVNVGLGRERLECRTLDIFEQMACPSD
jgi:hypothetical protein